MSQGPGRTVVHCSASLALGKEAIGMTLSAIEYAEMLHAEAAVVRSTFEKSARAKRLKFTVANAETGREYKGKLSEKNFTDLYQTRAMELRLYSKPGQYSRQLILAPSVQTFRSYRALVGFDEFGYLPAGMARDLINSADAMMRDTPDRRMLFFSNLSLGDSHPWFEMTLPRRITAASEEDEFPPHPRGHLYFGQTGVRIHRVALSDRLRRFYHLLYDDLGRPLTYDRCQTFPQLRGGWDTNYALNHNPGGASAIDILALVTAQRRGLGQCHFAYVNNEADFQRALHLLRESLRDGQVGIGFDVATTTAEISNPSSVTVREQSGITRYDRLKLVWKERKPQIARQRLAAIIKIIRNRPDGGPARRLCLDASNERYFAEETADLLAPLIPVQLVIAASAVDPLARPATSLNATATSTTMNTNRLGDLEAANVNEGRHALPADDYVKTDYRLVLKDAGRYLCVPDPQTGAHGDTFDSGKLAELALMAGTTGKIIPPTGWRAELMSDRKNRSVSM